MNSILNMTGLNDAVLTARAVAGQRDAFAQIVTRYQSLVCSLAYSATGSLSQSEDLAQETFIAAWKGLGTLREPEKLRSWLCSIARNIIAGAVRNRKQEPVHTAQPLDTAIDLPSPETLPVDRAISREEETILWRSLEHIPEVYREPLVLFYREGQSIESVAQELELSEEAVKQRLSRGRKLLKMEVEAFVENTLRQSAPGKEFTSTVLAGLPMLTLPAGASAIGAAASKGSAAVKSASLLSVIAGMLAPILGALGGFLTMIGPIKNARSPRERSVLIITMVIFCCIFVNGLVTSFLFRDNEQLFIIIFMTQFIGGVAIVATGAFFARRLRLRTQTEEERIQEKADPKLPFGKPESKGFKWNAYAWLIALTFGNPFAMLTVNAANAHDSMVVCVILAVLAATFFFNRRIFLRKQDQVLQIWRTISIVQFPLLLTVIYLRWERWTGKSPWQLKGYDLILPAVGFFLFAVAIIHWLAIKRMVGSSSRIPNK
jgi:RNA polymerase sigma factor (sigma-70 family)